MHSAAFVAYVTDSTLSGAAARGARRAALLDGRSPGGALRGPPGDSVLAARPARRRGLAWRARPARAC